MKKDWKYYLEGTLKKLKKLPDEKFDYSTTLDVVCDSAHCGTVGCIMGWMGVWYPSSKFHKSCECAEVESIGLDFDEFNSLFLGSEYPLYELESISLCGYSRKDAIKRLTKFIREKKKHERRVRQGLVVPLHP